MRRYGLRLNQTGSRLYQRDDRQASYCGPYEPGKALRYHHVTLRESGPGVVASELARLGVATEEIRHVVTGPRLSVHHG